MTSPAAQAAGRAALARDLALDLAERGRVVVAYSGGVDSTFLLRAALDALPREAVLAVTLDTPYLARAELAGAADLARGLGAPHRVLPLPFPEALRRNPEDRCYLCKAVLFARLRELAEAEGFVHLLDGTNADDIHEHRPGLRALAELGVASPLLAAGLGKAAIRALSRERGLPTWDKPSSPCLLTRLPHGARVDAADLARIEAGEAILARAGFPVSRLRVHGDLARLAVPRERLAELAALAAGSDLPARLAALGFRHVTLDLAGYRAGDREPTET